MDISKPEKNEKENICNDHKPKRLDKNIKQYLFYMIFFVHHHFLHHYHCQHHYHQHQLLCMRKENIYNLQKIRTQNKKVKVIVYKKFNSLILLFLAFQLLLFNSSFIINLFTRPKEARVHFSS